MDTLRLIVLLLEQTIFTYLPLRLSFKSHLESNHYAYHNHNSLWELKTFDLCPDDTQFFESTHSISCRRCSYKGEVKKAWIKKGGWLYNVGHTSKQAEALAKKCNQYS